MSDFLPPFNSHRTAVDHRFVGQFAALFRPERTLASSLSSLPQVFVQTATLALITANMAIDGHVANANAQALGQPVGNLLRTPLLLRQQ